MRAPELRDLTIAWLRARHPEAIIVPELSVADWGGASIDVAAITPTHIVGVEIKAEGDSPSRLDLQGAVYPRVAREMWLLPDESIREKCFAKKPGSRSASAMECAGRWAFRNAITTGSTLTKPSG